MSLNYFRKMLFITIMNNAKSVKHLTKNFIFFLSFLVENKKKAYDPGDFSLFNQSQ